MEWFEQWFKKEYDELYGDRDDTQAQLQVAALLSAVSLNENALILDVGCGKGRHVRELQQRGFAAIGIDLSLYLLKEASQFSHAFACSDMRALPFREGTFDMLCSFFTSFGYFKTREENLLLIETFAALIKPGGYLFLDLMHADFLKKSLPKCDTKNVGNKRVTQDRYIQDAYVCKDITIEHDLDRIEKFHERVMLFESEELQTIFKWYNLRVVTLFGDEQGSPFVPTSPRMSFILQKEL